MEILQVENLSFTYPAAQDKALDNVTFSVSEGDFIVLCGESGSGKTTLLKMLKRELSPYGEKSGRVLYRGMEQSLLDDRTAAGAIGFVLQNPERQVVTDKVWHELAFGLENLGAGTPAIRRRVGEMASYFGIQQWFRKNTAELSGGQKQILNLASVMVMQPDILVLDEPTSQLDPVAASDFITTLQKLNRELGLTVILAEHTLEDVFPIADKVLVLEDAKLILSGAPRNVGEELRKSGDDARMLCGLPSAVRIYRQLGIDAPCPLTVREGRAFLSEHFNKEENTAEPSAYRPTGEPAAEMKDIWFRYGRDLPDVLRGVTFSVYRGENFCILGGNATGKTTTLRMLAGLLRPCRGKIAIDGEKLHHGKDNSLRRGKIALLPQDPSDVFIKDTVAEDFHEICRAMGYDKQQTGQLTKKTCQKTGVSHLLQKHPYDLSGGEQQKCALTKILLTQPDILLLDEPTKGIDAFSKRVLAKILMELRRDGVTIVTVTHDVEFAADNASRCALFFDGELLPAEPPAAFFSGNNFYTTAANRIARSLYQNAVTCDDVVKMCKENGGTP